MVARLEYPTGMICGYEQKADFALLKMNVGEVVEQAGSSGF